MANFISENIQSLLSTYTFEVDPDCTNEDLTCVICKNLLRDAYQNICECKYCRKCILAYINDGKEYCPGAKVECREDLLVIDRGLFPNAVLNKRVLQVKVRCPNEACQFTSKLNQMEDHLRLCSKQQMECPFTKVGCLRASANEDSLGTHLNRDVLAHSQMLMEVFDNLKNEFGGLKQELRVNKLEMASLREEFKLKEREVLEERRMSQEERRILTIVVDELKGHIAALRDQMKCAEENKKMQTELGEELRGEIAIEREESIRMRNEVKTLKMELGDEREESRKMRGEIAALKIENGTHGEEARKMRVQVVALKMEIGNEREESRKMRAEIEVLRGDMQRIKDSTARQEDKYSRKGAEVSHLLPVYMSQDILLEEVTGIIDRRADKLTEVPDCFSVCINNGVVVGSLWFKVDGFDDLRNKRGTIFSPHLYSHINGYKLRIRVDVSYRGDLNMSSIICKGGYDDVLSWPARGLSVSVSLIDQSTKKAHKTVTIKYNNRYCAKPIDKDNDSYGEFWLVNLFSLASTTGLIVSDSVLLLVTARPP